MKKIIIITFMFVFLISMVTAMNGTLGTAKPTATLYNANNLTGNKMNENVTIKPVAVKEVIVDHARPLDENIKQARDMKNRLTMNPNETKDHIKDHARQVNNKMQRLTDDQKRMIAEEENMKQVRELKENKTRNVSERLKNINKSQILIGLNNALSHVKNENARIRIEKNMDRFAEKYQKRLDNMESVNVTIDKKTNQTIIKAKEEVKFFGFIKGKTNKEFNINVNGTVTEKKHFFRFLYRNIE